MPTTTELQATDLAAGRPRFGAGRPDGLVRAPSDAPSDALSDVPSDALSEAPSEANGLAAAWRLHLQRHAGDIAAAAAAVDGDFAVAIAVGEGRTVAALDRFAMQTLCWRQHGDGVQVAARADRLAGPGAELDPQALYDYIFFHVIPSPRTIYRGVQRLPPGHCLSALGGQVTVQPYWRASFTEPVRGNFDALRGRFRDLLRNAVAAELDGGKAGCFLSGGTDSSTVAGMIGEVTGRPAATYSIGFEADGYDEMAFANLVARHFGTEHHAHYVTPADLVRSMPLVAASYDQPFGNSSALPAYHCARMAREDGVTRILAGDGGDELFGGNTRYARQRLFEAYSHLPLSLRPGLIDWWADTGLAARLPLLRKAASYVQQARVPMPDRLNLTNMLDTLGAGQVCTPDFLAQVDVGGPAQQQRTVWQAADAPSLLNRQLAFDWRYTLAESDLPKVRGTTALAGLQVGFPLLDQALVDFSAGLPLDYKLRGPALRWFFKEALRGFLPDAVLTKKKQGFGLPFGVWALRDAALLALVRDALHTLAGRGIVQPAFLQTLLQTHLPAHPGYYGEMVWILVMLELWLRVHAPDYRVT